jgi:hypothetical protein
MPALNVNRSAASQLLGSFDGLCLCVKNRAGALGIRLTDGPPLVVNLYEHFVVTMAAHLMLLSIVDFQPRADGVSPERFTIK